eukprot:g2240.t1
MLALLLWPSISLLSKLDELMEENVRRKALMITILKQNRHSTTQGRRRRSLFNKSQMEVEEELQDKSISNKIKCAITMVTIPASAFFIIFGILVVTVSMNCNPTLWPSCKVKVPLCNLNSITCNCAVLEIKDHNLTHLPTELDAMRGLRLLTVAKGPLEAIPALRRFSKLSYLNLQHNELDTLPLLPTSIAQVDIRKNRIKVLHNMVVYKNLFSFYAAYNQLELMPQFGIGILNVGLSYNKITKVSENNVWDSANILELAGNNITELPENAMGSFLQYLFINNNNISKLPDWLGRSGISFLDARHNHLHSLPTSLSGSKLNSLWIAGNPLCKNGWVRKAPENVKAIVAEPGMGCDLQCTSSCLDIFKGDGECDFQCNNLKCDSDGGDCTE